MYKFLFKPLFDYIVAVVLLLVTLPVMAAIAVLLYIFNDRQILFVQLRPGFQEKPFYIYKFKTMNDKKSPDGTLLSDDERLTKVGKFLRTTSFDELPQLINILRGELSFVGPRPLLMQYLPHYDDNQRRRHDVKPGITGLAQVSGRNQLSWEQKFQLDTDYVDNLCLKLDLKIILKTIIKVVASESVTVSSTQVSPEPFSSKKNKPN